MAEFDLFQPRQRAEPDTPIERPLSQVSQAVPNCSTEPPDASESRKPQETAIPVPAPRHPPPTVAPVATVAGYAEGIGYMLALKKPRGVGVHRFNHLLKDLQTFERVWLEKAVALGWTAHDMFGCWHNPTSSRVDCDGLLHLLQGRKLLDLTAGSATILAQPKLGRIQTFTRAFDRSHGALLWTAYGNLPQVLIAEP